MAFCAAKPSKPTSTRGHKIHTCCKKRPIFANRIWLSVGVLQFPASAFRAESGGKLRALTIHTHLKTLERDGATYRRSGPDYWFLPSARAYAREFLLALRAYLPFRAAVAYLSGWEFSGASSASPQR